MEAILTTIRVEMVKIATIRNSYSREAPPSSLKDDSLSQTPVEKDLKARAAKRAGQAKAERALKLAKICEWPRF